MDPARQVGLCPTRERARRLPLRLAGILTIEKGLQSGGDSLRQAEAGQVGREIDCDGEGHGDLHIWTTAQPSTSVTTFPATSVSRKSRPACRYVSRV